MKQVGKRRGFICCLAQYGVELNSGRFFGTILSKSIKISFEMSESGLNYIKQFKMGGGFFC